MAICFRSDSTIYIAGIVLTVVGAVLVLIFLTIITLICCGVIGTQKTEPKEEIEPAPEPEVRSTHCRAGWGH